MWDPCFPQWHSRVQTFIFGFIHRHRDPPLFIIVNGESMSYHKYMSIARFPKPCQCQWSRCGKTIENPSNAMVYPEKKLTIVPVYSDTKSSLLGLSCWSCEAPGSDIQRHGLWHCSNSQSADIGGALCGVFPCDHFFNLVRLGQTFFLWWCFWAQYSTAVLI